MKHPQKGFLLMLRGALGSREGLASLIHQNQVLQGISLNQF